MPPRQIADCCASCCIMAKYHDVDAIQVKLWHVFQSGRLVRRAPAPKGPRTVATGGAKRNPWEENSWLAPEGQRKRDGELILMPPPLPLWGRVIRFIARVPLRSTRGYSL